MLTAKYSIYQNFKLRHCRIFERVTATGQATGRRQRQGRWKAVQRAASAWPQDTPGKPRQRTGSHAAQSA
jgi:hypothetical protein